MIYGKVPAPQAQQGRRRSHGRGCVEPRGTAGMALSCTDAGTAPPCPVGDARAGLQSRCRCFSSLAASLGNKVPNQSESKWEGTGRTVLTFLPATSGVSRAMGLERPSLLSSQMNGSSGHITAAL